MQFTMFVICLTLLYQRNARCTSNANPLDGVVELGEGDVDVEQKEAIRR